jgi:oxygen-independent coproporphyrinogen-3 oxidase
MAFGVYVHIPYCLQRCVYCDFATYEAHQILPPSDYVAKVKSEITHLAPGIQKSAPLKKLDTLYFGGGTPSLLEPELLIEIVDCLKDQGFLFNAGTEMTLEINPATLNETKIEKLLRAGFNRFSVGAQSFNDKHLKSAHRKHSSKETRDTLSLLKNLGANFSADLLFALPNQTSDELKYDLEEFLSFDPNHVSPYCLTVPETNPMSKNRPPENEQIEMFSMIEKALLSGGLHRYEISNFSKPGFESRHNMIYWDDDPYWGIGLSSHSYLKNKKWGSRFWNPRSIGDYTSKISKMTERGAAPWSLDTILSSDGEHLLEHQAMTDFFHISLRRQNGLVASDFLKKFGKTVEDVASKEIESLSSQGLIERSVGGSFKLTQEGVLLSNFVFEKFTFLG